MSAYDNDPRVVTWQADDLYEVIDAGGACYDVALERAGVGGRAWMVIPHYRPEGWSRLKAATFDTADEAIRSLIGGPR